MYRKVFPFPDTVFKKKQQQEGNNKKLVEVYRMKTT